MSDTPNYYKVLGLSRAASQSEIRDAYRSLAKKRHPDQPGGSAEDFSLLQEAHATLVDPNRRRHHDEALDLAHAADQLSGLDFGSLGDELSSRRQQRDASGPSFGERLRGRFRRKSEPSSERAGNRTTGQGSSDSRVRGRYEVREGRWYEPQDFDPEPLTWKSAMFCLFGTLLAFVAVGQLGLWASQVANPGALEGLTVLEPIMFVPYTLIGLIAAYFTFRYAGYAGLALAFVAMLVVGQRGGPGGSGQPENLLQFGALGMFLLLAVIYFGKRRDDNARRR